MYLYDGLNWYILFHSNSINAHLKHKKKTINNNSICYIIIQNDCAEYRYNKYNKYYIDILVILRVNINTSVYL